MRRVDAQPDHGQQQLVTRVQHEGMARAAGTPPGRALQALLLTDGVAWQQVGHQVGERRQP